MANQWEESNFDEQAIGDIETAKLALRWALDKIKGLQEDGLKSKQNVQEKSSQITFLENQLKTKNAELEKLLSSHDEEMKSSQSSLEYQFKAKLERLSEREKEVEDRITRQENEFKDKETKLLADYQKKSDELRGRWSNIESELWQLRQEQILKQQEFEKIYGGKLEDEKHNLSEETETIKASLEKNYDIKLHELEKREHTLSEELKKQEAVFKWAKDSWQKDADEREKKLKVKELDVDKKLLEKNQVIDDFKVRNELLEKQIKDLPESLKKRDDDIDRYRSSLESLEGVIRTLEEEKRNLRESYEDKNGSLSNALDTERTHYKDLEIEIPKRLKIAIEHERARFHDKLGEIEYNYKEDVRKKQEEVDYLSKNLKTFEGTIKILQDERNNFSQKIEKLQAQREIKSDEHSFREKQLGSEFEIKLKVELEKNMQGLRHEIDTAQRIYSDNLKLKIEEIAHLRKELETLSVDKISLQDQVSEMRRNMDVVNERHEGEVLSVKTKEKDDYKTNLSAQTDDMERTYNAEKTKLQVDFERQLGNINVILSKREEEISRFKLNLQKSEEEKKILILEERQKAKSGLDLQGKTFQDTTRLYEDKIVQLSKNIESVKLEKEEMLLLDRDRMEKIYSEKERDLDERLDAKEEEISRLREDSLHAKHDKEIVLGQFLKEKEELKRQVVELADKYSQSETEHHIKLENIIKREAEKFHNVLDKKESEMEALRLLKVNQEESYRKSLENFRSKLSDAVGKLETIKHVADDRQNQIASLHMEMTEAKKNYDHELMALKNKSDEYSRQLKEVKGEYEEQKNNFESSSDENHKRMNDTMLKLRKTEEYLKGSMDKLDEARREIELRKIESDKKEENIRQLESDVENQKNESLKVVEEFRRRETSHKSALENMQAEINQRESVISRLKNAVNDKKIILTEMNALKEKLASKEMAMDKLSSEIKPLTEKAMMYKNDLTISLTKAKELEGVYNKAVNDNERLTNDLDVVTTKYNRAKYMYESEKKRKEEIDASVQVSTSALKEKESEMKNMNSVLTQLQKDYTRLSGLYEAEKKRKEEVYSLAQTSSSDLREKEEEFKKLTDSFNQTQKDYNRSSSMYENEKKKKEELDVLAQSSSSALREKVEENQNLNRTLERIKEDLTLNLKLMKEKDEAIEYLTEEMSKLNKVKKEYMKGRKGIDQLKERINSWKKS
jgi:predicted  nucleic acid-binding Zn-ribbon protein